MPAQKPISIAQFRQMVGVSVDSGDSGHDKHSAMVGACGRWLLTQAGVFVFAVDVGRFTGAGVYGTPGVPDLVGWVRMAILHSAPMKETHWAQFLAVECKVAKDDLTPAQKAFRKEAEEAGVIYILARWSGKPGDNPTADLERQWLLREEPKQ